MPTDAQTTPTRRLFDTLSKARESSPHNPLVRQVWARVFEVDENDFRAIYRGLSRLHELVDLTESAINAATIPNKQLCQRSLPNIRRALTVWNLDAHWSHVQSFLSERVMLDLEHCVEWVNGFDVEEVVNPVEIEKLSEELTEAFNSVEASNLEPEVKRVVLELLENIRRLLVDYRIRGADALKEALEQAIAKLITVRSKITKTPTWEKVVKVLVTLDKVYSAARKFAPLVAPTIRLLLPSSVSSMADDQASIK